jgi:hypothetical protein
MDHRGSVSNRHALRYKFKYLGMKWRFLKFELEKEALPPVPRGDHVALENQSVLERSIVFESYERGLNLSESLTCGGYESSTLLDESQTSLNQFPASELDSVFTQDDLLKGIRNVQIFQALEPIRPSPPTTGRQQQLGPAKPMVFSPRPPEACKPSSSLASKAPRQRSPRPPGNQPGKRSVPLKEQIQRLDISKSFKA